MYWNVVKTCELSSNLALNWYMRCIEIVMENLQALSDGTWTDTWDVLKSTTMKLF